MDRDGLNLRRISFEGSYNDSPAWSPSRQYSEIAYASRIERRPFDIVVHDFETRQTRQLTTGRGSNESPSWAPNGLHLAFTSNRSGSDQVFTMHRDGSNPKQLTREGNNTTSALGQPPSKPAIEAAADETHTDPPGTGSHRFGGSPFRAVVRGGCLFFGFARPGDGE